MTDLAHVAALEASGRAALPALHEQLMDDWLLRVSGGETKRVNSANPVAAGARPGDVMAAAAALYAGRGLPCRFRLTPLAHPDADAMLADAGYAPVDPSWTMIATLEPLPPDPGVGLSSTADPTWLARVEPLSGRSAAAAAVQARLLAAIPGPLALAVIEEEGAPIAAGYASLGHGRAQLSDIVVAPDRRGRGVGRRLVTALLGQAQALGCDEAMLPVLADNAPARRLYRSLRFVDAYPYHYRVRQ